MNKLRLLMVTGLLLVGSQSAAQDTKLETLLRTAPRSTNTAAYINIPALRALMADGALKGELATSTSEVRVVSEMDLKSLEPKWEIGEAAMRMAPSVDNLAKVVGGYVDSVMNKQVVWSPKQSYLIPSDGMNLKFVRPADRQMLSSWISSNGSTPVSPYLLQQTKQPEQFLAIMIAIDLDNYLSPIALSKKISSLDSLKGIDVTNIAKTLASAKGITIIVGRRSLAECILTIEFSTSPNELLPFAGKMLSEILTAHGSPVSEVASWSVKVQGNSLAYQGAISESSLDSLLGIFSIQDQAEDIEQHLKGPSTSNIDPILEATKTYFNKVESNITKIRNQTPRNGGERATWNSQSARRIDGLGTLNVDPVVVDYAAQVASLLRNTSLTTQQANISAASDRAQYSGYYGNGYYDPNAYYSVDNSSSINARARAVGSSDFRTTLSTLDQMTADMRRSLTSKYNKQF